MSEDNKPISQYIRENRHTYTREAINQQLLGMGHTSTDISAAWEAIQVSEEAYGRIPRGRNVAGQPLFWAVLTGFVLASLGLPVLFAAFLTSEMLAPGVFFLVIVGVGLIAGFTFRDHNPPLGMGLLAGVFTAIVLPAIGFTLFLGICIAQYVF